MFSRFLLFLFLPESDPNHAGHDQIQHSLTAGLVRMGWEVSIKNTKAKPLKQRLGKNRKPPIFNFNIKKF